MDPISITTGIISLYSTLLQLKKFKDSYTEAPQIILAIERDCSITLKIIRKAKSRLDRLDRVLTADDHINDESIKRDLVDNIKELKPQILSLQNDLKRFLELPNTNFHQLKSWVTRPSQVRRLKDWHRKIVERRGHFERLQRDLDSENIVRILQRQSWASNSPTIPDSPIMILNGKDEKGRSLSTSTIATSASSQIATLGHEVLLDALNSGQANDVAMILKDGEVDPNFQTRKTGMYPLHIAAARGDHVSMAHLLDFGANIEAQDYRGKTPLHIAAKNDRADALQLLVNRRADPNAHDNAGRAALWYAAGHGTSHSALALLTSLGTAVINHRCADAAIPTSLWAAAARGQVDTATTLLRAGADPKATDAQGSTLLHKVGWPAAATLTPLLLEHGADATARDREGKLPLHRAAEEGRTGIAARLLRLTDVDSRAGDGATALIHAAERGKLRMCRFLAEHGGADWRRCDNDGNDAFYVACANGHVLCATYLLGLARGGRDVSAGNSVGNTALHAAARWGHVELVRWLLDLGADRGALSMRDSPGVGVTPAQAASVERESTGETKARRARQEEIAKLIDEFALDDDPVEWEVEITGPSRGLPGSGYG